MTTSTKLTHEDAPGIEVFFLKVTPEVAGELLELNAKGQRTITKATVERYASDMITDDWTINGDTIRISKDNELLDGQHRLSSIVASDIPQILLVVTGLDKEAMITIDSGRKRTFSDMLKMEGVSNHANVAAAISRSWYWYKGNYGIRNVGRIDNPMFLGASPSHAAKKAFAEKVEKAFEITFEAAAKFGSYASTKRRGISASTYSLAWVVLSGIDRDRRNAGEESDLRELFFNELLHEPKSNKADYPVNALTNRLMRLNKNDTLDNVDQLDALFTAFTKWAKGERLETIRRPQRPVRAALLQMPYGFVEKSF